MGSGDETSSSLAQPVTTPTKDHSPLLLRMRGNVFSGLQLVRISEARIIEVAFVHAGGYGGWLTTTNAI